MTNIMFFISDECKICLELIYLYMDYLIGISALQTAFKYGLRHDDNQFLK